MFTKIGPIILFLILQLFFLQAQIVNSSSLRVKYRNYNSRLTVEDKKNIYDFFLRNKLVDTNMSFQIMLIDSKINRRLSLKRNSNFMKYISKLKGLGEIKFVLIDCTPSRYEIFVDCIKLPKDLK